VWTNIKIIFFSILLGVLVIAGMFLFRRSSDGSGVPDDNGLPDRVGSGVDESIERNGDIKDGIEESRRAVDRASGNISNAQNKLRSAIEILRDAKEKNRSDMVG